MAFNIFCRAALSGESIVVFGDGTQTRDFTYVGDVVAATRGARAALGFEPATDFVDGLRAEFDWVASALQPG